MPAPTRAPSARWRSFSPSDAPSPVVPNTVTLVQPSASDWRAVRHQARQVDRPVFGEGRGEGDGKTEAVRAERQVRFP